MKKLERKLKVFANRRRLAIIKLLLRNKEMIVSDIAIAIKLSFKATSKHLNILANADVLDKEQRNLEMYYRINKNNDSVICSLCSLISNSRE